MEIITLDFETYYSKEYSLSKLTTEEYVRDPRFEVIMLGVRWPDGHTEVVDGTHLDIKHWCERVEWGRYAVLCHNTLFDAAILSWRFGVNPAAWLDTLSMGRAMFGARNNSLASLAKRYNLDDKGTFVKNVMGMRRVDFSPSEFQQYAEYCLLDVELCFQLWELMSNGWYNPQEVDNRGPYPIEELKLIDLHIRMFTEPMLRLNSDKLKAHLDDVLAHKAALMEKVTASKEDLMSNQKFAATLEALGVAPPMKISPTTGKETFAFAKTDPGMKALLDHEDPTVQALAAARLGVKSTLEETRTQRFIDIASRDPRFPVPLKYAYARTKRSSGGDGINLQNLPSRGNTGLKSCIEAPPGWVIIDCDSSNIEARVLAWWAQQDDLTADFAAGVDVYCKLATKIYGRTITKADERERFVGKTATLGCFGPDTQVLTDSGVKSIIRVSSTDKLWDGESWVSHSGLLNRGFRLTETPMDLMLAATADHEILTEHGWRGWSEVHSNPSLLRSALNKATLPSYPGSRKSGKMGAGKDGTLECAAHAVGKEWYTEVISSIKKLKDAATALENNLQKPESNTGGMQTSYQTIAREKDSSTGFRPVSTGARFRLLASMLTMVVGVYGSIKSGLKTVEHFFNTLSLSRVGTIPCLSWTELTTNVGTNPVTYSGLRGTTTPVIGGLYRICKSKSNVLKQRMQTYDIALAGPNNRFTVLTAKGPVIVHNCGYQTGAMKLKLTLKAAKPPVELEDHDAERIINTYRSSVPHIVNLWADGEKAIRAMYHDEAMWMGREGVVLVEGRKGIKLPSGLYISYPQLHRIMGEKFSRWAYKDDTGIVDIYGGKLVENICQALARIIVMSQMLRISRKLPVKLTVHDSVIALAREEEAKEARAYVEECMRWVPKWAQGCPINCESKWGYNYGDTRK